MPPKRSKPYDWSVWKTPGAIFGIINFFTIIFGAFLAYAATIREVDNRLTKIETILTYRVLPAIKEK